MVLEIKDYTKVIKHNTILDNVNLSLVGGNIYGLRGVNGSGKTMLIRAICGLIYPSAGEVSINGEILGKDISFPRSIGVLIEAPAFLPNYTGYKNLKLLADIKGKATDERIGEVLELVGLNKDDKRTYRKFSLGMKQKLGIAAAIMEEPDIVILDEPFNALDAETAEKVKELIIKEKQRGALVILACHDAAALVDLSDTVITIENGRIKNVENKEEQLK